MTVRFRFNLATYLLLCALVHCAFLAPAPAPRSSGNAYQKDRQSNLVEIKLPVKITSMEDLVAWAKNAMRSMASRIDITLASVDEPVEEKQEKVVNSPPSPARIRQREPVSFSFEPGRPAAPSALLSTFASLLNPESSFESLLDDQNDLNRDAVLPYGNVNAYLPVLFNEVELSKYREEALRKFYSESEQNKRDKNRNENNNKAKTTSRFSPGTGQLPLTSAKVRVGNAEVKSSITKNNNNNNEKLTPVISVPFEAVVTITREHVAEPLRENVPEPTRQSFEETRDPPDEFPPYFEKEYPRREIPAEPEFKKKTKDSSKKRQISSLGDLLRMLGLTKRLTSKKKDSNLFRGTKAESTNSKPRKPSEQFSPPPLIQFEDESPRPQRNETSQRQEFDDDEEEEMGSLGSLTDLLPLVIPILEDLSDPESDSDLGEVLEAAIPLLEGLSGGDPDAPNILDMLGPIIMTIIGGKDGTGSDVGALIGPLLQIVGPLIGPLSGPLSTAISGGGGMGSSVASLLTAIIAPLAQPGPDGNSPISIITARVLATLSKELKPGQPGGLDIGALIGSVLTGVISGTSAGLSGSSSDGNAPHKPYGAYGPGPVQAGSVNTGTNAGFVNRGQQQQQQQHINVLQQQLNPHDPRPVPAPFNILRPSGVVHRTTQRPTYVNVPQRIHPGPSPPLQNFVHHHTAGLVQAGTSNAGNGGSSYLPYGNNAVPANSANPLNLVGASIKDILGGGIGLVSSLINAVFGVSGASSADKPGPVYGPPAQGYH